MSVLSSVGSSSFYCMLTSIVDTSAVFYLPCLPVSPSDTVFLRWQREEKVSAGAVAGSRGSWVVAGGPWVVAGGSWVVAGDHGW